MDREQVTKKECERQLLAYIDVPYFRNNPSYIELWRRYYNCHRDPHILLLMYHKHISTYYHWIYIELAEHFLRAKEPELAHFIIGEALRDGVYNPERLREALSRIPIFEKKYTRGDMLCILNQKNISALGTIWNKYAERPYCDIHLDAPHLSFEMSRTRQYLALRGIRPAQGKIDATPINTLAHGSDSSFYQTLFFTECQSQKNKKDTLVDSEALEQLLRPSVGRCSTHEVQQGGQAERPGLKVTDEKGFLSSGDVDKPGEHRAGLQPIEGAATKDPLVNSNGTANAQDWKSMLERKAKVHRLPKNLEIEPEFVIGEFVHILQESGSDHYVIMRIASDADITQTVACRTYHMKGITYEQALLLVQVKDYEFCTVGSALYVLYEFDKLGTLTQILQYCDDVTCLHYVVQVLALIREFADAGVHIHKLDLSVNTNFDIVLTDFDLTPFDLHSAQETTAQANQFFARFNISLVGDRSSLEAELGEKMAAPSFRRAQLQHKTAVLNDL